jgi:hypothetical protein
MLLGSGPKSLQVQVAEGSVRIPADSLQRLLPGVEKLRIETVDENALEQAADNGGDLAIADINPNQVVRLVGTTSLLQESEVSVLAELELTDGQIRIVPRDIRLGASNSPTIPVVAQKALTQLFTLSIDPGSLPLRITPTKLRAVDDALEISGRARDLTLGAETASGS